MRTFIRNIIVLMLSLISMQTIAQRKFTHPGISYTQADIDRMKAMIAAKQEPFYSAFQIFKNDRYTTYRDYDYPLPKASNGEPVIWTNRQLWFETFGKVAWHNALMWKLTGDTYYADRAVGTLNRYIGVHSTVPYGTNCLDNGAATPLIEAAELMRDYAGWNTEDQQGFKDFLVYPGYSSKEDYYEKYSNSDTIQNKVTIYWNIFQGDPGRHGNQGLYGMRCMLAMGVYLDNDTIYDRALRKVLSMGHRADDLPYPYGPRTGVAKTSLMPDYHLSWDQNPHYGHLTIGDIVDYGADDELKYWIYDNGQCQESARDQGHVMDGMGNMADIAQVAWNQGDDIYTKYDDRLLKGIIFSAKYNYGWRNNHCNNEKYWQGEDDFEPTAENGQFYQCMSRNNAWKSLKISPYSENDSTWSRGKKYFNPLKMLMAYNVRLGRDADSVKWISRALTVNEDSLAAQKLQSDYESYNDFASECPLLDYRTVWMAGDGGTFENGLHVSKLIELPGTLNAVDYDYYNNEISGEGHTYYNKGVTRTDNLYREEGGMPVKDDGGYVLTNMQDSAWMNYSFSLAEAGIYKIKVNAHVKADGARLSFAVDASRMHGVDASATSGYEDITLGTIKLNAGAQVLRIYVADAADAVDLKSITMEKATSDDNVVINYEWNSRDYATTTRAGSLSTDKSDTNLYSTGYSSSTQAVFTMAATDMSYRVRKAQDYLVMKGQNLEHATLKTATYKLTDTSADASATSTSGHANLYTQADNDGNTLLIWKVDSSTNKRIRPLLNACYTSSYDSYILRALSLQVYGTSVYKNVSIDGFNFYTQEQMDNLGYISTSIGTVTMPTNDADDTIYDLQGRRVTIPAKGIYIRGKKKYIVK